MPDLAQARLSRELFLFAFGMPAGAFESGIADRVIALLEEDELRRGERLFAVGDAPDFFYFVREGSLRIRRPAGPGRVVHERRVVGLLDGLLDRPRCAEGTALTDVRLMKVRSESWLELLDDSFDLARATILGLSRSIGALEQRARAGGELPDTARSLPRARGDRVPAGRWSPIDRLALLVQAPLLRGGGVQPLSDLAMLTEERALEAGETLSESGAPLDRITYVMEGEIAAARGTPPVVRTAGPGEIVGGLAWAAETSSALATRATRPTRILSFRIEDWFDLMEEHFDMVRAALSGLSAAYERLVGEGDPP